MGKGSNGIPRESRHILRMDEMFSVRHIRQRVEEGLVDRVLELLFLRGHPHDIRFARECINHIKDVLNHFRCRTLCRL